MRQTKSVVLLAVAIPLAAACMFFTYYTARLIYANLATPDIASHRQSGMYMGAVAFPLASFVFGSLCRQCLKAASRSREPS